MEQTLTKDEKLVLQLQDLYNRVEGVRAIVVVNIDGLLVSAYPVGDEENPHDNPTGGPQVAAMAATLIGLAERTLRRLDQGELERLMMDGEEGTMVVYPSGRASVAVLVARDVNMGKVLFATKQTAKDVKAILDG